MRNTRARLMVVLLMGACLALLGCEDDNDNDGNSQVQGTWTGVVTASGLDNDVTLDFSFTFDENGNVTSFVGGPPTTSLSGSIAVASDDSVSGTLHSTHNTHDGVETETTVWQWSGRLVSANQMTVSIVAQWSNTSGSGSSGSYLVSGTLTRQ